MLAVDELVYRKKIMTALALGNSWHRRRAGPQDRLALKAVPCNWYHLPFNCWVVKADEPEYRLHAVSPRPDHTWDLISLDLQP